MLVLEVYATAISKRGFVLLFLVMAGSDNRICSSIQVLGGGLMFILDIDNNQGLRT